MRNPVRLSLRLASLDDAPAIFNLVYKNPHPFLRTATLADIENWIKGGVCWIIRDLQTGAIIGACNIKVPVTSPDRQPDPAEFGGIFLDPNYREPGVSDALAVLALSSYFWDTDPESPTPIPLISHVHVDNPNPRPLLSRLGFVKTRTIPVPAGTPGFENMPRDNEGRLFGDEFELPPRRRVELFRKMAELLDTQMVGQIPAQIEPALAMNPAELRRLASLLEAQ